ncbi:1-acyl-sn-glycerol-3-phosphate acyltransferase [Pseudoalteromonas sp. SCSIO 43095]|uniref:Acyltransferase YihG n=1 Tax=Pseudoalteromonas haloplanktis TaxID=228 RepID=A0A9W4VWP2_PSEHA|nr:MULTISPECIES: acetyltransferase [Pseudoalteromonas]EWS99000.1 acyltransferase [Pseudoalteromonas sp. SCSIO_11900]MCK8104151.1 acetyltransferase [Pseudoalteromonas sp. 2CM36K]MCK8137026.1 acetyltransferase [Pseudoalteromonas sp. 2CM28B]MDN3489160.1 acetyltransferase [Pseudoalteromonas sp. APC 3694]MDX1360703.1 acetyltransferase [Pseudoalteromonas tetraodonis]
MLKKWLPNWLNGLIVGCVLFANLIIFGALVLTLGLVKLVLPIPVVSKLLHSAYKGWCKGNRLGLWLGCNDIKVNISGEVNANSWYLLISNHISWLDIAVLSSLNALPAPKFFLKDELKYVPFIGTGAWAMGMPFMKRVTKAQLAKNPNLKGLDVERTKRSCRNFRHHPTTIVNFVEGTRFTAQKHLHQQSPFQHLLKPKAGGTAFALEVLNEQFDAMLNTSLVYSGQSDHVCRNILKGELESIHITIEVMPINTQMIGSYQTDKAFRAQFQQYLNNLWTVKDKQLSAIHIQQASTELTPSKEIEIP